MAFLSFLLCLMLLASLRQQLQAQALTMAPDFGYMKSVYNASDLPESETYDYIVVGGGTAGCPLAATLSEKHSVLVLERGDVPRAKPNVLNLSGFFANLMEEEDKEGTTPAQKFTSEDGVQSARGRVLGGSSMINAGFYSRAEPRFFERSGVDWDMGSVYEAYRWVEKVIVSQPELAPWQTAVKNALLSADIGPDNGFTLEHLIGTKVSGSTFDRTGQRHGAVELLNKGNFKNLRIGVHAMVEKILFSTKSTEPKAIGVLYTDSNGKSHTAFVRPKGEVIISAGALGSPQLLLLSGIGQNSYLSSLNIPVILSNPNVGKFMVDNPRNNINIVLPFKTDPSTVQVVGITDDYYFEAVSSFLPTVATPDPFGYFSRKSSVTLNIALLASKLSDPSSRGNLSLSKPAGAKPTPRVRFNYFQHPSDLKQCVAAMRDTEEMLKSDAMDGFKFADSTGKNRDFWYYGPALPINTSDGHAMREFCRSSVTTIWHYHGGCLVGKVVDGNYRVIGAKSLRVVDGSTFVTSPGTNPQATLMMIGRYLGLKMLREREEVRSEK